jgi:hypothetical protein
MKSQIIKSVFITTLVLLLPQKLHATPAVAGFVRIREVQALSQFVIAHGASELSRVLLLNFLQFGGGLGEATDESAATQQVQTERQERGGSITIAWSENNDELSGFSNKTGRWQKLKIEPQEKIQPNCVEFVGAVRLKDGIAAYSGETGTWDVVQLPETSTVMPAVSPDVAQFKDGEHFYAFSAATGRWTSPTDPAMKTLTIHYLSPKHMSAAELHARLIDWMQTVPASEVKGSIQWLDGVLSLLPRTKTWYEAAEAEIVKLDVPGAGNGASGMPGGLGGGFGGGFGGGAGAGFGSAREVSSTGLIITWSENKDEIRGFSNSKGEWDVLKVEKLERIIPVVGDEVAAVRIGDSMAAFSAAKAQWDVIQLSEGSKAVPSVFKGYVKVEDNGHLYTFADAKGQWTSPTDPELQPAMKQLSGIGTRTPFDREAFDQWLHTLPPYKGRGIRLTFQGNEVTVHTTRQSWMKEVLAWIEKAHGATDSGNTEPSASIRPGRSVDQIESEISELREEFKRLELAVGDGIKKVDSTKDGKEDHLRELRELVEKSFDLRQKLQRLEAQRMKLKLQLIETNLDAREKAREAIVERRMTELRNGNVQPTAIIQSQNFGLPITGAPIGLAGPPNIPISGPAGLESRRTNSDNRIQWRQPVEIVKELREFRRLFLGYERNLPSDHEQVKLWSQSLETLMSQGHLTSENTENQRESRLAKAKYSLAIMEHHREKAKRDWDYAWSAYQSKMRLLKLDVEDARLAFDTKFADRDRMQKLADKGVVTTQEFQKASSEVSGAEIQLKRAEELLKLYVDIEAQEPELNPDSLNAEK